MENNVSPPYDPAVALVATIVLGRRVDSAIREEIRTGAAVLPNARR